MKKRVSIRRITRNSSRARGIQTQKQPRVYIPQNTSKASLLTTLALERIRRASKIRCLSSMVSFPKTSVSYLTGARFNWLAPVEMLFSILYVYLLWCSWHQHHTTGLLKILLFTSFICFACVSMSLPFNLEFSSHTLCACMHACMHTPTHARLSKSYFCGHAKFAFYPVLSFN